MRKRLGVAVVAAFVGLAVSALAADWEKALKKGLASDFSKERRQAIAGIAVDTKKGLKALWKVLESKNVIRMDWYVRESAYEALQGAQSAEAQKEISSLLKTKGKIFCKEALAYAVVWQMRTAILDSLSDDDPAETLRKSRGLAYVALALPVLKAGDPEGVLKARLSTLFNDKNSRVRRAAMAGFMALPDKASITVLVAHLGSLERKKKKQYPEWIRTREALEALTGEDFGEDPGAWQAWWKARKDSFRFEDVIAAKKKASDDQKTSRATVVRADNVEFSLTVDRFGSGYPLVVLGQRHYDHLYFRPYFFGIESLCRVYYIQIPKVEDYKGLKKDPSTGLVTYPTEILAKGVASALTKSGLKSFAVLAHGAGASTLAMKLTASHPKLVSHLIMINPRSNGEAYTLAVENVIRYGRVKRSAEIVHGAENLMLNDGGEPIYEAKDDEEFEGNSRAINNVQHRDSTRPEVGAIDYHHSSPDGTEALADDSWSVSKIYAAAPFRKPTLIFLGTLDPWVPEAEVMTVASAFKKARLSKLKNAGSFPFISQPYAFNEQVKGFLAKAAKRSRK